MRDMSVTEETFQLLRSWLKVLDTKNIEDVVVTEETSQEEILPLKAEALLNI